MNFIKSKGVFNSFVVNIQRINGFCVNPMNQTNRSNTITFWFANEETTTWRYQDDEQEVFKEESEWLMSRCGYASNNKIAFGANMQERE